MNLSMKMKSQGLWMTLFFTSSIKLNKFDFEGSKRKVSVFKVLVVMVLVIAIIFAAAILIMKRIRFNKHNNRNYDKNDER